MAKKSTLYQYAVLWHPNDQQAEAGEKTIVLVEPDTLLASDQNSAFIQASREIPDEYLDALDQIDILVRPF